jgi:S-adenosylmethionine-dependent methyltransferase
MKNLIDWVEWAMIPRALRTRHRDLAPEGMAHLNEELRRGFFDECSARYLDSEVGRSDLDDHLRRRLHASRLYYVPWLNAAKRLDGADVLEIGAGTGSSTVALAEQGARVTAVDVNEKHLAIARRRCELHGLDAEFIVANAADLSADLRSNRYDLVIFFAVLEHMTMPERLRSIADTFTMLVPGGCWAVVETPNRIWPFDSHTAQLPFFHWLPDSLAIKAAMDSPRREYAEWCTARPAEDVGFARWGRGASFHELDAALGAGYSVHSSLATHLRRNPLRRAKHAVSHSARVSSCLKSFAPLRDEGFFEPYLNLILHADAGAP